MKVNPHPRWSLRLVDESLMVFIASCHLEATAASGIVALSITADCFTVVALFVSAVLCLRERWKKIRNAGRGDRPGVL